MNPRGPSLWPAKERRSAFNASSPYRYRMSLYSLVIRGDCEPHVMFCAVVALQDNIRDKLHGIPIDVSVEIIGGKRKRRQSSSPELQPVLDAKGSKPARSMVRAGVFQSTNLSNGGFCYGRVVSAHRYFSHVKTPFVGRVHEGGLWFRQSVSEQFADDLSLWPLERQR